MKPTYFVLIRGRAQLLCTWSESHYTQYGQYANYVGVDGLGGYRKMLAEGWVDRRFRKPELFSSVVETFIGKQRKALVWKYPPKQIDRILLKKYPHLIPYRKD